MTSETLCANLIERYLSTRGLRFLRGDHDGEYFCVVDAHARAAACPPQDVPVVRRRVDDQCHSLAVFPVTDRPWLTNFADTWNRQNRGVTAIVHGSSDSERIGVSARRSQWIREDISFEDFASFVDRTIAAAIDLFGELTPVVELPSTAHRCCETSAGDSEARRRHRANRARCSFTSQRVVAGCEVWPTSWAGSKRRAEADWLHVTSRHENRVCGYRGIVQPVSSNNSLVAYVRDSLPD